jgi:hypothetical protein
MKSKTATLLNVLNVLAWIAFLGLMVKAGAIIISYCVSLSNVEGTRNLYDGMDMHSLRQYSFWHYTLSVAFLVSLTIIEGYIAFLVTKILSRIRMSSPFTHDISNLMQRVSYYLLGTWIIAMAYNIHTLWLMKRINGLQIATVPGEFILMVGIVFVFAQIFRRGVEIQSENELTV